MRLPPSSRLRDRSACAILDLKGLPQREVPPPMTLQNTEMMGIAAGATLVAGITGLGLWLALRKRPSPEEIELARRQFLTQSGRLVDGTVLDVCEVPAKDGRTLTMLLYEYRNGGVDYECAQDITDMRDVLDASRVQSGFPCSVRYQPGNPQNSIVVAEKWTGLRAGIPVLPVYNDPDPLNRSHLR
jgi:hypothetical protein